MKNEIHRKLTSIILATIMVAGGVTFAIPGAVPEAAAQSTNANLYVSAENSAFDNVFTGLNVVEVVVRDPDRTIRSGSDIAAEPRVTVDGDLLRMVHGNDGSWYGYFAEANIDKIDDNNATTFNDAISYGMVCTDEVKQSINDNNIESDSVRCATATGDDDNGDHPVIRTPKAINNRDGGDNLGSIGLNNTELGDYRWPFIQVYDFDDESPVVVEYEKGGDAQSVTLYYDSDPDEYGTGLELGRDRYPQGGGIIMTMTDLAMNVDPTDSDTWTFMTTDNSTHTNYQAAYYYLFDDDGACQVGNISQGPINRGVEGIDDNLYLTIDTDKDGSMAVEFRVPHGGNQMASNPDRDITCTTTNSLGAKLISDNGVNRDANMNNNNENIRIVTFIEDDSGVFTNTDSDSDTPNFYVPMSANRGTTAVIDHNDSTMSVVVGHAFATITLDDDAVGGVWNSGEEIPVTLTDADINRKAMGDEDITVSDPDFTIIPSVRIGNPITLANTMSVMIGDGSDSVLVKANNTNKDMNRFSVDSFSDVARLMPKSITSSNNTVMFNNVTDGADLVDFLRDDTAQVKSNINSPSPATFQYLNFDVQSIGKLASAAFVWDGGSVPIDGVAGKDNGLVGITDVDVEMIPDGEKNVGIILDFADGVAISNDETYPVVVDLFSFGQMGDGVAPSDRINNAIYRLQLEESGDNTGVFEGSMEYIMLNQINVRQSSTYEDIEPIDDTIVLIVHNDMTDEDSIRINYLDLGADGVATQIADQVEAPTTSGTVSFDADNYKVADTVTVTLEDADLNTDVETIDIYTVVNDRYVIDREGENESGELRLDRSTNPNRYVVYTDNDGERVWEPQSDRYPPRASLAEDIAFDMVGVRGYGTNSAGDAFGRVLDITFDDQIWLSGCNISGDNGLGSTGFTLIESGADTGVFTGDFQIPSKYCHRSTTNPSGEARSTTGVDMEVNYADYRDASGETIEVGDSAGIRANTGSVSLDRTVYPVPFGTAVDFEVKITEGTQTRTSYQMPHTIFPVHASGAFVNQDGSLPSTSYLAGGDLTVHVRINDPDFDISASGEDKIAETVTRNGMSTHGPLKVTISRGADAVVIATAGGPTDNMRGVITTGSDVMVEREGTTTERVGNVLVESKVTMPQTRELGPIIEIAPDAGIFELDLPIRYTDGPASNQCPTTVSFEPLNGEERIVNNNEESAQTRFSDGAVNHCVLQGDIITVEYTDPTDASGNPNTVTDSATFDLRNGVLQSDKSVYIIGQDMILTLIEPDLDLESDEAETYSLDLIEWDSDAASLSMGAAGKARSSANFDPEPSDLRETGDSTGIFQVVVEIPEELGGDRVERGEEITLEYTDFGPSGADYVGDDNEDVNLTVFTSNFGATIELDQKVYTWTDKVYVTIVAPDHNFDSDLVDEIGETNADPIRISTRGDELEPYRLVETGTDTGIFTGEVILTGFRHDADGDTTTGTNGYDVVDTPSSGSGPTDGKLPTSDDDGITVSFEFSEDEIVVATALVRWSIGEVQWLETSYPAQGTGIVRVIDRDMNLDPESVDNFGIDVYSDSDSGGIDLTVTETNEATGVFEGTVFFTTTDESSGHRLRVAEGDTITAEYTDGTLPNPYSTNDDIDVSAAAIIGTIVPPLERAPVSNARVVDSFGNTLASVSVDQQVQVTADVINGQDRTQSFAYLVQIQDANGVTVSLSWIEGSLNPGQSLSPAQSWTPDMPGSYTATVFVWESVDNPTALSPPGTVTVNVR